MQTHGLFDVSDKISWKKLNLLYICYKRARLCMLVFNKYKKETVPAALISTGCSFLSLGALTARA